MTEFEPGNPEAAAEFEQKLALNSVIEQYLGDEKEFLEGFDGEDRLGAVYGMLIELGEDPDIILVEAGVLEREGEDEV
jgi:hypothetical protein